MNNFEYKNKEKILFGKAPFQGSRLKSPPERGSFSPMVGAVSLKTEFMTRSGRRCTGLI